MIIRVCSKSLSRISAIVQAFSLTSLCYKTFCEHILYRNNVCASLISKEVSDGPVIVLCSLLCRISLLVLHEIQFLLKCFAYILRVSF